MIVCPASIFAISLTNSENGFAIILIASIGTTITYIHDGTAAGARVLTTPFMPCILILVICTVKNTIMARAIGTMGLAVGVYAPGISPTRLQERMNTKMHQKSLSRCYQNCRRFWRLMFRILKHRWNFMVHRGRREEFRAGINKY